MNPVGTSLAATTGPVVADVVLEGGGVKGIALVGALQPLVQDGWTFARVAGTSAGAVVGAVLAATQQRGESLDRLEDIARSLDYRRFRDRGSWGGVLARVPGLGLLGDLLSVLVEDGAYEGAYLHDWVRGTLADLGVHTFGDLLLDDPGGDGGVHHRYRLVVVASDVSRHRMVRLPWDYEEAYGLDPDDQPVADAVRASASIPFFFEPVQLRGARGTATLVDGALVSNYPIDIFDRQDEQMPRWPTVGVRLDTFGFDRPEPAVRPVRDPAHLGVALVETAIEGCQAAHALAPCNLARSIRVDTTGVSSVDFGLDAAAEDHLLAQGRAAAERFLSGWSFEGWLRECRGVPSTSARPGQ
ncbi:MAG: patatin-like phospholipase family protein [Marmoricola sp.]